MEVDPVADGGEVGVLEVRIVEVVEIVQHAHLMAGGEEGFDQVRTDEAGAAGDKDFHGVDVGKPAPALASGKEKDQRATASKLRLPLLPSGPGGVCPA